MERQSPRHPCLILFSLGRCCGHTQERSHVAQQVWHLPLPPTLCSVYTLLKLLPGRLPRWAHLILFFLFQEIEFYFIMTDSNQGCKSPRIMTNTFRAKILFLLDSDLCQTDTRITFVFSKISNDDRIGKFSCSSRGWIFPEYDVKADQLGDRPSHLPTLSQYFLYLVNYVHKWLTEAKTLLNPLNVDPSSIL